MRTSRNTRTRAASPARQAGNGEFPIGISFEYRANTIKAKGKPIDLVFPKEGLGWDLEASASERHQEARGGAEARRLGGVDAAMELYAKNFAIVAVPGVAAAAQCTCRLREASGEERLRLGREEPRQDPRRVDQALRFEDPNQEVDWQPAQWITRRLAPLARRGRGADTCDVTGVRRATLRRAWHRRYPQEPSAASRRCRRSTLAVLRGELDGASSVPRAAARRRCCGSSPASSRRRRDRSCRTAATCRGCRRATRLRHRLPVVRAVSEPHDPRQRRLRPRQPAPGPRRDPGARRGAADARRASRGGRQVSRSAFRRPAAADRARARACDGAGAAAARRAAVGARRHGARPPARRNPRAAAAPQASRRSWSRTIRRRRCRWPTASS